MDSRRGRDELQLAAAGDGIARFINQGIWELRDRLGPINWQFMATKGFDAEDFEAFLKLLPREAGGLPLRHALEVRHPSFKCRVLSRFRRAKVRCYMDDEPKSAAEMKEIRIERKRAQDADGIKAMAEIAAEDVAIRKRTAKLRALRLAKEASDLAAPPAAKATPKKKKSK